MPNCNDLINRVFQTSTQGYDFDTRYYTFAFFLNSPYDQFFPAVDQKLRLRMGTDVLTILDASERDLASIHSEFHDIYDSHCEKYYHPSFNYVFVCAIDSTEQSQEKLVQMLDWIAGIRKIRDTVTVILTVPLAGDTIQSLAELPDKIFEDNRVYLYTITRQMSVVRKNTLTDAVAGVTIIGSYRDMVVEHDRRMSQAAEKVNQFRNRVTDESLLAKLKTSENKQWSSMHCKFFDCRLDLFFAYCQEMCSKTKTLDRDTVYKIMEDLYSQVKIEPDSMKPLLLQAIRMLPRVYPPAKKRNAESDPSLEVRFERLYGRNGHKVVNLSLKTTLAHMQGTAHRMSMSYYVVEMFRRFLPYRLPGSSGNLLEEFKRYLNDYISELSKSMESKEYRLVEVLRKAQEIDDSTIEGALTPYIRAYLEMHMLHTKIRFWMDVRSFLIAPNEEIVSVCDEAVNNTAQIQEFEKQCAENRFADGNYEQISVDECTVLDVLGFLNGDAAAEKRYQAIRDLAQKKQLTDFMDIDNRIEDIFGCDLIRYVYEDQPVQFVSDTYTIRAYERNGKYMIG